jgi:hypothetical protein
MEFLAIGEKRIDKLQLTIDDCHDPDSQSSIVNLKSSIVREWTFAAR